jgi:hypothetical protein
MTLISTADIQWFLSAGTTSAGGYGGYGVPGQSLGQWMSPTVINTTPLDDLFEDISGNENAAGQIDYQCLFVVNFTTTGNIANNPVVWMPLALYSNAASTIQCAVDPIGPTLFNGTTQQAQLITSSLQAPAGVDTWVYPSTTFAGGVPMPDLPPFYCCAIWFKRTALDVGATTTTPDGFTVYLKFDSQG